MSPGAATSVDCELGPSVQETAQDFRLPAMVVTDIVPKAINDVVVCGSDFVEMFADQIGRASCRERV